jgi:hypothetical protein
MDVVFVFKVFYHRFRRTQVTIAAGAGGHVKVTMFVYLTAELCVMMMMMVVNNIVKLFYGSLD